MNIILLSSLMFLISCNPEIKADIYKDTSKLNPSNTIIESQASATATDVNSLTASKDQELLITLTYTHSESLNANSCEVNSLVNGSISTACSCDGAGVCTVGITGDSGYTGQVNFSYSVTINSLASNQATGQVNVTDIGGTTNGNWILIPANAGGLGLSAFYVMQYEAKAWEDANSNSTIDAGELVATGQGVNEATHIPVSFPDDMPWTNITAHSAAAECESLGTGYGLISNSEWMAIARDAEVQGENWTGQTVGVGCFYKGNSGGTTVGIGTTNGDSCGYNPATNPDSGTSRDLRARHKLSTGDFVYDMAGNSWEWVDWDSTTPGYQIGPTTCNAAHTELPAVACGALSDADYNSSTGTYDSTLGFGRFYGGTGGGTSRGGSQSGSVSGIYTVWFFASPAMAFGNAGLRCVYRP